MNSNTGSPKVGNSAACTRRVQYHRDCITRSLVLTGPDHRLAPGPVTRAEAGIEKIREAAELAYRPKVGKYLGRYPAAHGGDGGTCEYWRYLRAAVLALYLVPSSAQVP